MSRTLHVIDQPGGIAEAAVLRLSVEAARRGAQESDERHAWLLFGGEATRDAARAIGLRDEQFRLLPRPVGLHSFLPVALSKPRSLINEAHRVVCWTEGATQIVSQIGCAHVARRVDHAGLTPFARQIIQQAYHASQGGQPTSREMLREQWGVTPETTVFALIGDRFGRIDTATAMMTIALTHEALKAVHPERADVRLLCHPMAHRRAEAAELSRMLSIGEHLIQHESIAMPWSVLHGCDLALSLVPSDAGLSILWADAMGLPIVMPDNPEIPLLDEIEQRIRCRSVKPKDVADALTQWTIAASPVQASA